MMKIVNQMQIKKPKSLTDIQERDTITSKKLSNILNSLKNLPENRSTSLIGDSDFHSTHSELNPVANSAVVEAVSVFVGLRQQMP